MIYTADAAIQSAPGVFSVDSDEVQDGVHTAMLRIETTTNEALAAILGTGVTVRSFRELIPRMNDIFIRLVTGEGK